MYNIGAVISILGAIGLIYKYFFKGSWNELFNLITDSSKFHSNIVFGFADVLPLVLIIVGGALMLNARKEN
jgi:hypothetical protein